MDNARTGHKRPPCEDEKHAINEAKPYLLKQALAKLTEVSPLRVRPAASSRLEVEMRNWRACFEAWIAEQRSNTMRRSKSDPLSRLLFLHRAGPSRIDGHTVLLALNQCVKTSPPTQPRHLHALMFRFGFSSLSPLQTTLISAYSQCGNLADARRMFGEITHRNVVSWTALISAYVNHNRPEDALRVFRQMQADHVEPDRVALTIALSACADAGARETGEWIHAYARRVGGFENDLFFYNALLNIQRSHTVEGNAWSSQKLS
ncbi:Pentatricopeptide repeat-containing protein [Acorus calamus]|uniref:Pentatricopeptide repeat-containing protein n=1 Tax=Acorus calamus TaxID=4465 RepID=A0AAV9C640_ACOCL|nr:Pentatricopeptide repeat-containing protein [Acorus calamus]